MYLSLLIFTLTLLMTHPSMAAADESCPSLETSSIALTSGTLQLSAKTQPQTIEISQSFNLTVSICQNNKPYGGQLKFDAQMPLHKHGMNYQASVINQKNGQYLILGSLLHMPGLWRFSFALDTLSQPLFYNYVLP